MFNGHLTSLRIKIFADGADLNGILEMAARPWVAGFTTNPTLMRKAGVVSYEVFGRTLLEHVGVLPVSLEVFSDDFDEMRRQALKIASWGTNVYVKVPVTNTRGESSSDLVHALSSDGVKLNVTALMRPEQVKRVARSLAEGVPAIVSVFAGRVADTGRDPVSLMRDCLREIDGLQGVELLWASPREVLNLVQADEIGCHIITMTNDLLAKLGTLGRDLDEFSLDTVKMFRSDAEAAGFAL
jgi:transaldolase